MPDIAALLADLGPFLRHVLNVVGAPGDVHRQEFLDAINAVSPPPVPPEPAPDPAAADQAAELAAAKTRVAELEAQLAGE